MPPPSPTTAPSATPTEVLPDFDPPQIISIQRSSDMINQRDCQEPISVDIVVEAMDASGPPQVLLYYQAPGGQWANTTMRRESDTIFRAKLGPVRLAGELYYYIVAQDSTGNQVQTDTALIVVADCRAPTEPPPTSTPRPPSVPRPTNTRPPLPTARPTSTRAPTFTATPSRTPTVVTYGVAFTVGQTSAEVRAGETANFNATLRNTASLADNIEFVLNSAVMSGWSARMSIDGIDRGTGPVTIAVAANGTKVVTVGVTVASNATAGDAGEVYLSAVSKSSATASDSASFSVTVKE